MTGSKEYIERDEAIRKAIDACIKVVSHGITQFDAVDIAEMMESIPTADVEEMRHGKWLEEKEYYADDYSECNVRKVYACSLCGRTEKHQEPYCNCGAKMDGGKVI